MEEALIKMYLVGVSVCRVKGITEALRDSQVPPVTVGRLKQWMKSRPSGRLSSMCGVGREHSQLINSLLKSAKKDTDEEEFYNYVNFKDPLYSPAE